MPPRTSEHRLERTRMLGRGQTVAEKILGRAPARPAARREIRRQVPVVDFACFEARLVAEVETPSHETPEGRARDGWRDRCLRDAGWRMVRVPNALVIAGGDLALAPIRAAVDKRYS